MEPLNSNRGLLLSTAAILVLLPTAHAFAHNPIISHEYTADPNAIVYNGRVYIYCSNDETNDGGYDLREYTLISSDDLVNWRDHGEVWNSPRDTTWATQAYAPGVVERDDRFYLYFPNSGNNIGVAVADKPDGPFVDPLGRPLVDKSAALNTNVMWLFDPGAFIDDDGQAYLVFGGGSSGQNARIIKLGDDLISIEGSAVTINAPNFFEAPFLHKHEGVYFFSYSTDGPTTIDYMTSNDPMTGWVHQGTALPQPQNNGNNNHASIFEFQGEWYIAYHNRVVSGGATYKRSVNLDRISYSGPGTLQTARDTPEGVDQLKYGNPYDVIEAETIDRENGIETLNAGQGEDRYVYVGELQNGDWFQFTGFDFAGGADSVEFSVASGSSGGSIEIHIGSQNGELAGVCEVGATGGWESWETVTCEVNGLEGVQDVVFKTTGSGGGKLLNIDWYQFSGDGSPDTGGTGGVGGAGGAGAGGVPAGGTSTGGASTGGGPIAGGSAGTQTGGAQTGGAQSGGAQSGGAQSGGLPTGGAPSGGMPTGGAPSGGAQSGGTLASGGAPGSGGLASGGATSGGSPPASGGAATGGTTSGDVAGSEADDEGGCACATTGRSPARPYGSGLLLLAALAALGRRAHRSGRQPLGIPSA